MPDDFVIARSVQGWIGESGACQFNASSNNWRTRGRLCRCGGSGAMSSVGRPRRRRKRPDHAPADQH
jgi:hypothetical protein